MIILINGPFGVGKSVTVRLLARRLPQAMVYNPEQIGAVIRPLARLIMLFEDYQDLPLWRALTVQLAGLLIRLTGKTLVVPMSVTRPEYLAELTSGWSQFDSDVRCIWLTASEQSLRRRILTARDQRARPWRLAHIAAGLAAADDRTLGVHVATEGRSSSAVAAAINALLQSQHQR